jgi:hypothetical protein
VVPVSAATTAAAGSAARMAGASRRATWPLFPTSTRARDATKASHGVVHGDVQQARHGGGLGIGSARPRAS